MKSYVSMDPPLCLYYFCHATLRVMTNDDGDDDDGDTGVGRRVL